MFLPHQNVKSSFLTLKAVVVLQHASYMTLQTMMIDWPRVESVIRRRSG